jgi:hypothetical protein
LLPVVALGQIQVVSPTGQANPFRIVVSSKGKRLDVVELEPVTLRASSALLVHVAASASVALPHRPPDGGGNPTRRTGSICPREPLPRVLRRGETAGFEPFQLLGHGLLDDGRQIAVGDLRTHQRSKPLQLVIELGAGGELDPVPPRRQGLDDRGRPRGEDWGRADSIWNRRRSAPSVWTQAHMVDAGSGPLWFRLGRDNSVQTEFDARLEHVRTQ